MITDKRKEKIESIAYQTYLKYAHGSTENTLINIIEKRNIELLVFNRRLKLEDFPPDLHSAHLFYRTITFANNGVYIATNEGKNIIVLDNEIKFKLFTVAHELGHHFLHKKGKIYTNPSAFVEKDVMQEINEKLRYKDSTGKYYEIGETEVEKFESDYFASFLTMPIGTFDMAFVDCEGDIEKLSDLFWISPEKILQRIQFEQDRNARIVKNINRQSKNMQE